MFNSIWTAILTSPMIWNAFGLNFTCERYVWWVFIQRGAEMEREINRLGWKRLIDRERTEEWKRAIGNILNTLLNTKILQAFTPNIDLWKLFHQYILCVKVQWPNVSSNINRLPVIGISYIQKKAVTTSHYNNKDHWRGCS